MLLLEAESGDEPAGAGLPASHVAYSRLEDYLSRSTAIIGQAAAGVATRIDKKAPQGMLDAVDGETAHAKAVMEWLPPAPNANPRFDSKSRIQSCQTECASKAMKITDIRATTVTAPPEALLTCQRLSRRFYRTIC